MSKPWEEQGGHSNYMPQGNFNNSFGSYGGGFGSGFSAYNSFGSFGGLPMPESLYSGFLGKTAEQFSKISNLINSFVVLTEQIFTHSRLLKEKFEETNVFVEKVKVEWHENLKDEEKLKWKKRGLIATLALIVLFFLLRKKKQPSVMTNQVSMDEVFKLYKN
jgi:hypothetical protein